MAKVIINYGHNDTTGGGATGEKEETPHIGDAIRKALIAAGHTVYVVQEQDKDGDANFLSDTLDGVWKVARQLDADHGPIDLFIDVHQEGDSADVPGLFAIVPDAAGLLWFATNQAQPGDTRADNVLDMTFCRALAKYCGAIPGIGRRTSGVIEAGVMSETQTGVAEGGWRLAVFGGTYSLRDHMVRCVIECGDVTDPGVTDNPAYEGRIAAGVLQAVNEVFPIPINAPKPTPQPAIVMFNADGTPTDAGMKYLFSAKRQFSTGPVSHAYRAWCDAHGMYPEESKDPLAVPGGIIYTFGPLRIFYAHGVATVVGPHAKAA
jgi:hypothetical protein